ncbi:hypothetical protein HCB69_15975 [Listeria booriae]|uniref:Uncharacterized protein n=1 Tax=Listeria booriae TaxID=1552123 RepID=A0A842G5W7_9LIST|nr:hypothetical protein [Listeria booriae]MBC2285874.1 hypothetical protein [Listeria booriae]
MKTKKERLEIVNKVIKKIASLDRQFFLNKKDGQVAEMLLKNGRVYFRDDYTKAEIYAYHYRYFTKFSHGGTMQALILDFSEFIRTGVSKNGKNGYCGLYCTYWGYSDEGMKAIQDYAIELGYLVGTRDVRNKA